MPAATTTTTTATETKRQNGSGTTNTRRNQRGSFPLHGAVEETSEVVDTGRESLVIGTI
jgi:hypothetical protein